VNGGSKLLKSNLSISWEPWRNFQEPSAAHWVMPLIKFIELAVSNNQVDLRT
jgi:hypothetical protein